MPQGGYRIPQQGQIQLVIKNPNKTAVKLFLVPYDLRDMQAGSKTFVRQKCFATTEREGNDFPIHKECAQIGKQSLRYLIHLHICCPSKGRYYLYRNIRVVFANRVPDGKEQLRNENMVPDPKYSLWKPQYETRGSISSQSEVVRQRYSINDQVSLDCKSTNMEFGAAGSALANECDIDNRNKIVQVSHMGRNIEARIGWGRNDHQ